MGVRLFAQEPRGGGSRPNGGINNSARGRRNQVRAAIHHSWQEISRTIKLIDQWGNETIVEQQGKLNRTKHKRVLEILD